MSAMQDGPERIVGVVTAKNLLLAIAVGIGLVACAILGLGVQVLTSALTSSCLSSSGVG